ncbi:ABC transporter ATP-binding protein [Acrocarpospora catenulata]|uniref:ABC transporter ATP-binding protein n=1 Tax=Acrocarpospora catenulata TaxID=2836182 RepID=UPI001BDB1C51|nr:ABC transporter ATP-binding protein [Acrocarpospora catenulata]
MTETRMTGGRMMSLAGWRLLTRELAPRRRALAFLALWSVLESLPSLLSGLAMAAALDQGFLAGNAAAGLAWLGVLGVAMVLQSLATRNTFPWLAQIVEPIRDGLVRVVVEGALRQAVEHDERADGSVVSRLGRQTETVRNLIAALLRTLRPTLASLVLALVGLVALAPIVAALVAPLVAASLGLFAWLTRALAARQRASVLAGERVAQVSTDLFEGLRDVVAAGATGSARESADRALVAEARARQALARTSSLRTLIMFLGTGVPVLLILLLSPWLLRPGRLTPGELVGATTYLVGTLDPALRSLTGTIAAWGRQLGVLLHRIAETGAVGEATPHRKLRPTTFDLTIEGLTFAYGAAAEPVIDNLTMRVPAGRHLAVVGPSGTGKSTLARLLAGLLTPQSGEIRLGGVPVADVSRSRVALIPQEAYVFTGTLRENLTYLHPEPATADLEQSTIFPAAPGGGSPGGAIYRWSTTLDVLHTDATRGDLDEAVAALGLAELVDRLGGYEARLGVGGPVLSAGERQLIALARVYLSPAKVIVLDEATCHLDPATEALAEEAFATGGRTLIVIAHRITSARRADRILLLDGRSAQLRTHDDLLARSPRYAGLVANWDYQPAR